MKKIAILGLHLNFGGVEQAIVNQANMLCNDYDVKLVITYKKDEPSFYIDPKVKIDYLTNLYPNREEFKKCLKKFKLVSLIKEGFKSIKILYLKKKTMINYIKNSEDDILISSRVDITKLLSKYGKNQIKVAEEHRHHNNDEKYISNLKKSCKNIDYLVSVSKELNDYYSKEIPNTKCVYIPNGLDYFPNKTSKLNNKNIISVGRLSPEKGFLDLIDVFNIIHDLDKDIHLDIVGDGVEKSSIENKINQYCLQEHIKLHGFQKKDYINKLLEKSSLYLMCSFEESFGIVLIEAGSFGIPQIAFSSAQGANEIIQNNISGYLIDNRDKEEMAKKVVELINDNDRLIKMGEEARNIAKEFSFVEVQKRWLDFIKKTD